MKFLFDYFPIVCFFLAYKLYGIYIATAVTMIAAVLQVGVSWLVYRRLKTLYLVTLLLIVILGTATLLFHQAVFIKWKPSVIYWLFSVLLIGSQYVGKQSILAHLLNEHLTLPPAVLKQLNLAWGLFFFLMGCLNVYVLYRYSTNTWVNFKLFGTLGLTLLFIILQSFYIFRHLNRDKDTV